MFCLCFVVAKSTPGFLVLAFKPNLIHWMFAFNIKHLMKYSAALAPPHTVEAAILVSHDGSISTLTA